MFVCLFVCLFAFLIFVLVSRNGTCNNEQLAFQDAEAKHTAVLGAKNNAANILSEEEATEEITAAIQTAEAEATAAEEAYQTAKTLYEDGSATEKQKAAAYIEAKNKALAAQEAYTELADLCHLGAMAQETELHNSSSGSAAESEDDEIL